MSGPSATDAISALCLAWRRLRRHAATQTLGAAFVIQSALVFTGVATARLLGPEDRGWFALLTLIPAALTQFGDLGMPVALTNALSKGEKPEALAGVIHRSAGVQALILTALAGVALQLVTRGDERVANIAWVVVPTPAALLAYRYALAVLQGTRQFLLFNLLRMAMVLTFAITLVFLLVLEKGTLWTVTACWAALVLMLAVLSSLLLQRSGLLTSSRAENAASQRSKLRRFGLVSLLGAVSPAETFRVDQLVAGLTLSPTALGYYSVAIAFTNLPRFAAQSLGMVAYPSVAAASTRTEARRIAKRYVLAGSVLAGAVCLALAVTIPYLLPMLFGTAFAPARTTSQALLVAALFISVRRIVSEAARGLGHPGVTSAAELVMWLVLLPTLPAFALWWGLDGVVLAMTLGAASSLIVLVLRILAVEGSSRTPGARGIS